MTYTLTVREQIKAVLGDNWNGEFLVEDIERVYLAGLAAGRAQMREEAAKFCDARAEKHSMRSSASDAAMQEEASMCAHFIRALD